MKDHHLLKFVLALFITLSGCQQSEEASPKPIISIETIDPATDGTHGC